MESLLDANQVAAFSEHVQNILAKAAELRAVRLIKRMSKRTAATNQVKLSYALSRLHDLVGCSEEVRMQVMLTIKAGDKLNWREETLLFLESLNPSFWPPRHTTK